MKKAYLIGAVSSAIIHFPLLKEEEYVSYLLATIAWPVPAIIWLAYIRYVIWSTYQHDKNSS
jgi:hypothetical protein